MRQWDHAGFERGQEHVLAQGVRDPRGGRGVGDPVKASCPWSVRAGDRDSAGTLSTVPSRGIQT